MATAAVTKIDLKGKLPKIASGKVRELFAVDEETLLFVSSDRISAYDVIMQNGIPGKGVVLTKMSIYWFTYLTTQIPGLKTHYITSLMPGQVLSDQFQPDSDQLDQDLKERSMQVCRLRVLPIESIVRGYITGSGWAEYQRSGTVNGMKLPPGLIEGQRLPTPLWTPSTKAELGAHDENISPEKAREIIAHPKIAEQVERLSLQIYATAAARTEEVGIILADTKLEFGVDEQDNIVLVDEVLTPDSSRFWPKETWEENLGKAQPSFDKQILRDYLSSEGLKGKEGVIVPDRVVAKTADRYREAYERITGDKLGGV